MNKSDKPKWLGLLIICLIFTFAFSGCVDVEMKINQNGSSEIKYTITKNDPFFNSTKKDPSKIKAQIKNQINQINQRAAKKVVQLKNLTVNNDFIAATIYLSDLNLTNQNIKHQSLKNWLAENQSTNVINLKSKKFESINELNKNYQILKFDGIAISSLKVTVPGIITHLSSNGSSLKKDSAILSAGTGIIIYKKPSFAAKFFLCLLVISIAFLIFTTYQRKVKK